MPQRFEKIEPQGFYWSIYGIYEHLYVSGALRRLFSMGRFYHLLQRNEEKGTEIFGAFSHFRTVSESHYPVSISHEGRMLRCNIIAIQYVIVLKWLTAFVLCKNRSTPLVKYV